jgi:hypothetical protein
MTEVKPSNTMTLSECSKYDYMQGIRNKMTGWGKVCAKRQASGNSRAARIRRGLTKKGRVK